MMGMTSNLKMGNLVHIPSEVSLVARDDEGYAYEIIKTRRPMLGLYLSEGVDPGTSTVLYAGRRWEAFSNALYPIEQ